MSLTATREHSSSSSQSWRRRKHRGVNAAECDSGESTPATDTVDRRPLSEPVELPVIQECQCRVAEGVKKRWMNCGYSSLKYISCRCDDGVLVIDGTVPSYYFKQMAQELARSVEGIHQIENRLSVVDAVGSEPQEDHRTNDPSNE